MNAYKQHSLLEVSRDSSRNDANEPENNQALGKEPDPSRRLRRRIGSFLYPMKNRLERPLVERRLRKLGVKQVQFDQPSIICYGQKGFGGDIFLNQILGTLGRLDTVMCFGCGMGDEMALVARRLKPKRIMGCDYFSYKSAWDDVKRQVESDLDVAVDFEQIDLRKPAHGRLGNADLVISFAVLEHLRDMDVCFEQIKGFMGDGGWFASQWGPMWYSYSGDHISAELGFKAGYQHLLLSAEEYLDYYKNHPRNRAGVLAGRPTWLELGLHNFARYEEYLAAIQKWFGPVCFLKWQLSSEAFRFAKLYPQDWVKILGLYPGLTSLDLLLGGAAVLASNER